MLIAIHQEANSYSDRWIQFCEELSVQHKIVDCYDTNIIDELRGCDVLLWHWHLADRGSFLISKGLTVAIERMGIKVYPDFSTGWHYDDKVAQKYLFESLNFPLVPSYVFYSEESALAWIEQSSFPKVFKLRGGAGSVNVRLAKTSLQARKLVKKSFSKGFPVLNRRSILYDRIRQIKIKRSLDSILRFGGSLLRCVMPSEKEKTGARQIGYAYFQDFIPDNQYDTRLVVIGDRCVGLRRYCRENDFRASGSGNISYSQEYFPKALIRLAFELASKLKMQSVAFDFVQQGAEHLLVEVSYCFSMGKAYDGCPGYWNGSLMWIEAPVNLQRFIFEDVVNL